MDVDWIEGALPGLQDDGLRAPGGGMPLQQHPDYGRAVARLGAQVATCRLRAGGEEVARAQVLLRRLPLVGRVALIARGPLLRPGLDVAAVLGTCVEAVRARGCRWVIANLEQPLAPAAQRGAGLLRLRAGQPVALLDLAPEPAALRAAQHGKWRNRLRRAECGALTVQESRFDARRDDWILQEEAAQRQSRGYGGLPLAFTLAFAAQTPERVHLFRAFEAGECVAAMLVLRHGRGASYHIGWSGAAGRVANAHALLLWRAALAMRARGVETLDLGIADAAATPGLARFKRGSGARLLRLGPTVLRPPLLGGGLAWAARRGGSARWPEIA